MFEHPSCVKEEQRAFYRAYDLLAQEYAQDNKNVCFIDMNEFFYQSPADVGTFLNFRDIFVQDGLHMTDQGYEEYARYIAPRITQILQV